MAQQDNNDNIKNLYEALKNDYDLGTEQEFRQSLGDATARQNLYNAIKDDYDVGEEQDFETSLGYGTQSTPSAQSQPQATETAPQTVTEQPTANTAATTEQPQTASKPAIPLGGINYKYDTGKAAQMMANAPKIKPKEPTAEEKAEQSNYMIDNAEQNIDAPDYFEIDRDAPNHRIGITTKNYTDKLANEEFAKAEAAKQEYLKNNPEASDFHLSTAGVDPLSASNTRQRIASTYDDPKKIEQAVIERVQKDEKYIKANARKSALDMLLDNDDYKDYDFNALYTIADNFAKQAYDRAMADAIAKVRYTAAEKAKPKSGTEGFLQNMIDSNSMLTLAKGAVMTPEHVKAQEKAMVEYQKQHPYSSTAAAIVGMASDPAMRLGAGTGALVGKGIEKLALRNTPEVVRETEIGTRMLAMSPRYRRLQQIAQGSANFATFETAGEATRQLSEGDINGYALADKTIHGAVTGGVMSLAGNYIGNATDRAVMNSSSRAEAITKRIVGTGVGVGTEVAIFATPDAISRIQQGESSDDAILGSLKDAATMVLGFKAPHVVRGAIELGFMAHDSRRTPKTRSEELKRKGFWKAVGDRLASVPETSFTEEEKDELREHGYSDLADMSHKTFASSMANDETPKGALEYNPKAETIGTRTAPSEYFDRVAEMMQDNTISETARAKMAYVITGKKVPMSSVVGSNIGQTDDGRYYVDAMSAKGVISHRVFDNEAAAQRAQREVDHQAEINIIDIVERYKEAATSNAQLGEALDLLDGKQLSVKGLQYAASKYGEESQATKRGESKIDPLRFDLAQSYDEGSTLEDSEKNDALIRYEQARADLLSVLEDDAEKAAERGFSPLSAEERLSNIDNNPLDELSILREHDDANSTKANALLEYVNAKAAYDGLMDSTREKMDDAVEQSNAEVGRRTNPHTGMIQSAILKVQDEDGHDRKVYIIDGNVQMMDDGTMVDKEKSDKAILIYNEETGKKEFADINDFMSVDDPIDAEQERQMAADVARRAVAQREGDMIDGVLPFNAGDQYNIIDEKGQQHTVQIVGEAVNVQGQPIDGAVTVMLDGQQQPTVMTKEQLQLGANEAKRAAFIASKKQQEQADKKQQEQTNNPAEEQQQQAEQQAAPTFPFALNDELTIQTADGQQRKGVIIEETNADGLVQVDFGDHVEQVRPEELQGMITEYNNEAVQRPQVNTEQTQEAGQPTVDNSEMNAAESTVAPAPPTTEQTQQPTALSRIPTDENGEPMFEKASLKDAWEALVEMAGGNEETAIYTAQQMANNASEALAKEIKKKPKSAEKPLEIIANVQAHQAAVDALQKRVNFWNNVAGFKEAEARRAEEHAKAEKRQRMADARREQEKKGRYAEENKALGDYLDFRDYVMRTIATGGMRFKWSDDPNNPSTHGLASHLGMKGANKEMSKRIAFLSNETGLYPETAAHSLVESYADAMGLTEGYAEDVIDTQEALDTLLDVLASYDTPRAMFDAVVERHNEISEQEQGAEEYAQDYYESQEAQSMGMSLDEWRNYKEAVATQMQDMLNSATDQELTQIFAEAEQAARDAHNRDQETSQQLIQQTEDEINSTTTSNAGSDILPTEQSNIQATTAPSPTTGQGSNAEPTGIGSSNVEQGGGGNEQQESVSETSAEAHRVSTKLGNITVPEEAYPHPTDRFGRTKYTLQTHGLLATVSNDGSVEFQVDCRDNFAETPRRIVEEMEKRGYKTDVDSVMGHVITFDNYEDAKKAADIVNELNTEEEYNKWKAQRQTLKVVGKTLTRNGITEDGKPYKETLKVESLTNGKVEAELNTAGYGGLSSRTQGLSSEGKGTTNSEKKQEKEENSSLDKIDDWGEEIKGARKNAMKEVAQGIEDIDEHALAEKPLSQVWKRPDYAKLVAKGELTEQDARVLEGISRAMASETKPRITGRVGSWKRREQEKELADWVESTKKALKKVKDYAEGTEEQRATIEKELREGYDAASVMYSVLESIGYPDAKVGRFSLPEIKERKPFSGGRVITVYTVDGTVFNSVKEAKDEAVRRVRVGLGYDDVAYTERDFAVGYTRKVETKKTGKWQVEYIGGRNSYTINSKTFDTKEQAEEYAQKMKDKGYTTKVAEDEINEYVPDKYIISVRDPYTRKYIRMEGFDYDSEAEARDAVSSSIEELGHKANEVVSKIHSEENKTTLADRLKFYKNYDRKSNTYTLSVGMGSGKGYMPVASGLKYNEIQDYIAKNRGRIAQEVGEARKKMRSGVEFKPTTPRKGKDWRKGKDITAEEFGQTFDFRGVQFGNWANQADRQQALNECYDALMDMADVLGVSPRALSLGGELGMAFGSRGHGKANAHYELHEVVINLTKTKGAGSLAHEWWHALDNYFGRKGWNAHTMITDMAKQPTQGVRDEVLKAYLDITNAVDHSDYAKRNADSDYWGSIVEETARAFAEFVKGKVEAKGEHNDFLANKILSAEEWQETMYGMYKLFSDGKGEMTFDEFKKKPIALNGYRYPTPEELKEIGGKMQHLFDTVQEKVENGHTVLFQKGSARKPTPLQRKLGEAVVHIMKKAGIDVSMDVDEMRKALDKSLSGIWQDLTTPSVDVTSSSPKDVAKVKRINEKLQSLVESFKGQTNHRGALSELANVLETDGEGYANIKIAEGTTVHIRIDNHNAVAENFKKHGHTKDNVSIVIKSRRSPNSFKAHPDVELKEYVYTKEAIAEDGNLLSQVAESLSEMLQTGKFVDKSGKALINTSPLQILQAMTVYHGSPHSFEAFDHSHMGEGEGAQAHGWGTYVAKKKEVSEGYAAMDRDDDIYYLLKERLDTFHKIAKYAEGLWKDNRENYNSFADVYDDVVAEYRPNKYNKEAFEALAECSNVADIRKKEREFQRAAEEEAALLYEVEIPDDTGDNYLDEQKPYSSTEIESMVEQLRNVAKTQEEINAVNALKELSDKLLLKKQENNGQERPLGKTIVQSRGATYRHGGNLYRILEEASSPKTASQLLNKAGFVGIKYDSMSDGKCYVIFNEKDLKITNHVQFLKTESGEVYGFVKDGEMYLDPTLLNPNTPIHEYAHLWTNALMKAQPELWAHGKEMMKQLPLWEEVKNGPNYADIKNDEDLVASEVFSRLLGEDGEKRLEDMVEQSKDKGVFVHAETLTLAQRIREWLKKALMAVRSAFGHKWTKEEAKTVALDELKGMALKDFAEGFNPTEVATGENGVQKRFIGERGAENLDKAEKATTMMDNLNVAHKMEEAKKDAKAIKQATGWERGADGKWRYEQADFEYHPNGDAKKSSLYAGKPWAKEYDALVDKVLNDEPLTEAEDARFKELSKEYDELRTAYDHQEKSWLDDYVSDPDLFKAYPQLKQVKVEFYDDPSTDTAGSYNNSGNNGLGVIKINMANANDVRSVLAHEIQHAIQHIEGFATGGNKETGNEIREKASAWAWRNELAAIAKDHPDIVSDLKIEKLAEENYGLLGAGLPSKEVRDKGLNLFARGYDNEGYEDAYRMVYENGKVNYGNNTSDTETYRHLGGEVEARNVQSRLNMTDEERRQSLASETEDVAREDQIFLQDALGGNSAMESRDASDHSEEEQSIIDEAKKNGTYMKAPNGKPSKLTPRQWVQVRTKAFKKWFGDWEKDPDNSSKAVDENGEPKVFYHNTDAEFTIFNEALNGSHTDAGWLGDGFYFYGDENEGNGYGKNKMAVFLNVREPYYATSKENNELAEANDRDKSREFREMVEDEGCDGVYYNGDLRQETVVFSPNQIKSATDNNGDFSTSNDDIRYRPGDESSYFENERQLSRAKAYVYRAEHPTPTLSDYYKATNATFDIVEKDDMDGTWESMKASGKYEFHKSPLSSSEYLIDNKNGDIYRKSGHWGSVASCNWDLGSSGDHHIRSYTKYAIGKCNIKDFTAIKTADWEVDYWRKKIADFDNIHSRLNDETEPITDERISYENDPVAKWLGKPWRTAKQRREFAERERQRMLDTAKDTAEKLHISDRMEILTSTEGLKGKQAKAKGWFNPKTGKIVIVAPNHVSRADIIKTVLHEGVAHYGLRKLFGENFDNFLHNVFFNADPEIRSKIIEKMNKHGWDYKEATEEYLADLAEDTDFENVNASWWSKIKDWFMQMLHSVGLAGAHFKDAITDNELRYILWRSYDNLKNPGSRRNFFNVAEDIAMQNHLKVGNYAEGTTESGMAAEPASDDGLRYRSTIQSPGGGVARDYYEQKTRKLENVEERKEKAKNLWWRLGMAYGDSMAALKAFTEGVLKETGGEMHSFEDAYKAENRLASSNKTQQEAWSRDYFKPIENLIDKLKKTGHSTYEDLKMYIVAKHGLERNEVLAQRDYNDYIAAAQKKLAEYLQANPNSRATIAMFATKTLADFRKRDYSGLTALTNESDVATAEAAAQQIVDDYEQKHGKQLCDEWWGAINAATKSSLKKRYDCGLLSKAAYDHVCDMFKYYIPLKGWDSDVAADEYEYKSNSRGQVGSPQMKRAGGRSSLADDPIATIAVEGMKAIQQSNRNMMKRHFLNFVMNNPTSLASLARQWYVYNPTTDTWSVDEPVIPIDADGDQIAQIVQQHEADMQALYQQGLAQYRKDHLKLGLNTTKPEQNEHKIKVLVGGEERVIYINGNPMVAQAINGVTNPDVNVGKVENFLLGVKNKMGAWFTSLYLAFVGANLSMDTIQAAAYTAIREDAAYNRQSMRNAALVFGKALMPQLVYKWEHGTLDTSNEVERYFDEFMRNGGETGFTQLFTVDKAKKDIDQFLKEARGGLTTVPAKAWHNLTDAIEFLNRSAEDTNRFICYMTSRQQGRDVARSIWDAKEITVNFNKKGDGSMGARQMNFAYIFFNAAVQSLRGFGRVLSSNPKKAGAVIASFAGAGFIVPMLNAALVAACAAMGGGDDDDDPMQWYWDLPEWERRNNVVMYIPFSNGRFIKIPLPHELRGFYGLGECAFTVFNGKQTVGEALSDAALNFNTMLPLDFTGNGGNIALTLTPTVFQPLTQVVANKDYFGKPIYRRSDYTALDPEWTKAYKGTSGLAIGISKFINSIDNDHPDVHKQSWDGAWNNPDVMEHLIGGYFGGAGKTWIQAYKTVSMAWDENARDLRNIPIASRFITTATDERSGGSNTNALYYDAIKEFNQTEHDLSDFKKYAKNGVDGYADILSEFKQTDEYRRYEIVEKYNSAISKMQGELKNIDDEDNAQAVSAVVSMLKRQMIETLQREEQAGYPEHKDGRDIMPTDTERGLKRIEKRLNQVTKARNRNEDGTRTDRVRQKEDDFIDEVERFNNSN